MHTINIHIHIYTYARTHTHTHMIHTYIFSSKDLSPYMSTVVHRELIYQILLNYSTIAAYNKGWESIGSKPRIFPRRCTWGQGEGWKGMGWRNDWRQPISVVVDLTEGRNVYLKWRQERNKFCLLPPYLFTAMVFKGGNTTPKAQIF